MNEKKKEKTINLEWDRATQDKAISAYTFIRRQLIIKSPFYAVLSMRLQPKIATPLQVINGCWCASTNGKHFIINPDGWLALTPKQQMWVMKHEILHCVLRHPTRIATRNPALWNIACMVGNTKIMMADGSSKPIAHIKPGEYVASPHGSNRVLGVVDSGIQEILELSVNNDGQLFCTKEHRFFTQKGLIQAQQITDSLQGWLFKGLVENQIHFGESYDRERERTFEDYEGVVLGNTGASSPWGWSQVRKVKSQAHEFGSFVFSGINSPVRVIDEVEFFSYYYKEQKWSHVLETACYSLPDGRVIEWDATILDDQEGADEAFAAFHRHTQTAGAVRSTDAEYVGNLAESQGAERAWLQIRAGAGRARTYDLITEHHAYYAEGILVHNCDFVVNMVLAHKKEDLLVEGALWDDRFQKMDADSIYQILKNELMEQRQSGENQCHGDESENQDHGQQGSSDKNQEAISQSNKDEVGSGQRRGGGQSGQDQFCVSGHSQQSQSDQGNQDENQFKVKRDRQREAEEFRELAERLGASPHSTMMDPFKNLDTGDELNPEDIERSKTQIENAWKAAFAQARQVASGKGDYPAGFEQIVERENAPRLSWERLLHQWVQARIREGYDWMRPNRRFVAEGIYLPGRGKPSLGDVVVFVDTSGSVSDKLLAAFLGEVEGILKAHPTRLFLVACDAKPYLVGEYEDACDFPLSLPIQGRGGTDFRSGVQWIEEHSGAFCKGEQYMDEIPRIAIYLTDGVGNYPKELPEGLNMLWVLSRNWEKGSRWYPPVGEAIIAFENLD